ncbi:hypothetical protein BJX64DRAFT_27348 [Aspergillus heterothallicus]
MRPPRLDTKSQRAASHQLSSEARFSRSDCSGSHGQPLPRSPGSSLSSAAPSSKPVFDRTILVFQGVFTFLVDAYPIYAASALGANSCMRSTFAAAFPLFGVAMYHQLGDRWASSLLAFLSLLMAPFP